MTYQRHTNRCINLRWKSQFRVPGSQDNFMLISYFHILTAQRCYTSQMTNNFSTGDYSGPTGLLSVVTCLLTLIFFCLFGILCLAREGSKYFSILDVRKRTFFSIRYVISQFETVNYFIAHNWFLFDKIKCPKK